MKFRMRITITLLVLAALLQSCSCTKKETKTNDMPKESTTIETAVETTVIETTTEEIVTEAIQETQEVVPETANEWTITPKPLLDEPEFLEGQMHTPISFRNAKQIILTHANYNIDDVIFLKAIQDYEDDIVKWKMNFAANNHEYEYEVNAMDGSIINFLVKSILYRQNPYLPPTDLTPKNSPNGAGTTPAKVISLDDAKKIIKNNTGLNMEGVVYSKTECSYATGMPKWVIEFNTGNKNYSYKIDAISGAILQSHIQ